MATYLPINNKRVKQPPISVAIDYSNPLCKDLVFEDAGYFSTYLTVGTRSRVTKEGIFRGFGSVLGSGSTDSIDTGFSAHAVKRTYLTIVNRNGSGGGGLGRILEKRTGATQSELLFVDSSNFLIYGRVFTGSPGQWAVSGFQNNTFNVVAVAFDSSSVSNVPDMYLNGIKQTIITQGSPSGSPLDVTDNYIVGNRKNDNARNFDGLIGPVFIWNRILSESEIATISSNPWQLFKKISTPYFLPSSGPTSLLKDSVIDYLIRNISEKDSNQSYFINSSVVSSYSSNYILRELLNKDSINNYQISNLLQKDQNSNYSIRNEISSVNNVSYSILNILSSDANQVFIVRNLVSDDSAQNYVVRGLLEKETQAIYNVNNITLKDYDGNYFVRNIIITDNIQNYLIQNNGLVVKDSNLNYSIRNIISVDSTINYDLLSSVLKDQIQQYSVLNSLINSGLVNYNIRNEVISEKTVNYSVTGLLSVIKDMTVSYYVNGALISDDVILYLASSSVADVYVSNFSSEYEIVLDESLDISLRVK